MRALGMLVCALLLVACTNRTGGVPQAGTSRSGTPRPDALTAAAALGDLRTIDYCTLLDEVGEYQLSSFESCRTEIDFIERTVGPLSSGDDPERVPYDYAEDLPPGVRVESRTADAGCVLWVGFADDVWLAVTISDVSEPPWSVPDVYCGLAEDVVAGVFAVIEDGQVGHATYGPDSFGRIDPCPLITGPEFAAFGGGSGPPVGGPSGHDCVNGRVTLSFGIDWRNSGGNAATVGGREAVVLANPDACHVSFKRPLPDEQRFTQKATVSVPGGDAEACRLARGAAGLVAPKLPQ